MMRGLSRSDGRARDTDDRCPESELARRHPDGLDRTSSENCAGKLRSEMVQAGIYSEIIQLLIDPVVKYCASELVIRPDRVVIENPPRSKAPNIRPYRKKSAVEGVLKPRQIEG